MATQNIPLNSDGSWTPVATGIPGLAQNGDDSSQEWCVHSGVPAESLRGFWIHPGKGFPVGYTSTGDLYAKGQGIVIIDD
jgi:hypothetical protein